MVKRRAQASCSAQAARWPACDVSLSYFFLSAGGSTQFVYFVVRVHLPMVEPLVSQARTTHLSQTYFFPAMSCETLCSDDSHLSSAYAVVTLAKVKETRVKEKTI